MARPTVLNSLEHQQKFDPCTDPSTPSINDVLPYPDECQTQLLWNWVEDFQNDYLSNISHIDQIHEWCRFHWKLFELLELWRTSWPLAVNLGAAGSTLGLRALLCLRGRSKGGGLSWTGGFPECSTELLCPNCCCFVISWKFMFAQTLTMKSKGQFVQWKERYGLDHWNRRNFSLVFFCFVQGSMFFGSQRISLLFMEAKEV